MSDCGGWTPEKPVTPEVKDICLQVKPDVEKMLKKHFDVYTPISFISQSLEGATRYVVKVQVGADVCFHAAISVVINNDEWPLVTDGVQYPKLLSDHLVPF